MSAPVDEPVHLCDPSTVWIDAFDFERSRIQKLLSLPIEHVGSTAVPGLPAKPIVDIQIGAPEFPPSSEIVRFLEDLGYENLGECGVPGRLYLRLRGPQSFNIHVVEFGGVHWRSNIALRDYLRRSVSARDTYATAKRAALEQGASSLLAYSAAKADVIARLLLQARAPSNAA